MPNESRPTGTDRTPDSAHYQDTLEFHARAAKERDGYYDWKPGCHGALHHSRWQLRTRELVIRGIREINRAAQIESVLDVGCGRGDFSNVLGSNFEHARILGADFSPDMIEIARRNALSNVEFDVASLPELDLGDRKVDVTVCLNVLHHILEQDQPRALSNMCARTRKGIVVEMKNSRCPYKRLKRGLRLSDGTRVYPTTASRVIETMKASGFELKSKRPIFILDILSPIVVLSFRAGRRN
ncbi:MAG: class I SAM-dependent methyltransferase [Kiritimatiellia bacterium]|jgi:2-polyprenyl-3-methyl-5-hydroxy-6-metoxy-1,4-benzoquinol methylase|nr:class I SAM-dependent methyltransferase [Kiritimatiellia bacterium]